MKERIGVFLKLNRLAFAAFFLPVLILVLAFAVTGIYPFGQQQLAVIDMYHQYVPFLGELQYKLQEGGSLFYSWNSGGGCNFWCLLSYYGASPLNLLLILFPKKLLMEGVSVILLIKIGLIGAFMFIYLKNVSLPADLEADRQAGWKTVAFSTMYALCSYVIGYYWCIMWLDAVMLLPLTMLGLNHLIEDGRMTLYTVTLALIVFCNYYIAIMVCIFILIYYPVLYFIKTPGNGVKGCLCITARAAGCSLLAIAMAGVMMLPTYISMKSAYYFSSDMPEDWTLYKDALDILNQLLPNAHLTYIEGLPNLCCGLLVTIMLVIYFITKEIPVKEKLLHAAFLICMFFSLNVNKLDFIWHGMHFPNQLPHRFSFVICFILVAMGYRAFNRIDGISTRTIGIVIGAGAGYYLLAQKIMNTVVDDMQVFFYYGMILLALYGVILLLYRNNKLVKKWFTVAIVIAVTAEMCITTCTEFDLIGNSSRETYNENKTGIMAVANVAEKMSGPTSEGGDGTFSRMEMDEAMIHNCPALYHYRGMGQFSSTLNANTTGLMEKIGLEGNPGGNRFNYNETSPVTNSITNVNYLIAKDSKIADPDFTYLSRIGNSRLYQSKYPLSIGYMLSPAIRTWDLSSDNPFINLNNYVKAATDGQVEKVFVDKGFGEIEDNGTYSYYESEGVVESRILDPARLGSLKLKYKTDTAEKYYVFVEATYAEEITIERERQIENIPVQSDCGSIINIGRLKKGEKFDIKVDFEKGHAGRVTCYVCTLDYDAWNKAYKTISDNPMTVTHGGDGYIMGEVDVAGDGVLVTSIPYEDGWTMKVDGNKKNISDLTGDAWISTGLSKGRHEIELKFTPPGLLLGAGISVLSILVLILLCRLRKNRLNRASLTQDDQLLQEFLQEESDYNTESE